MGQLDTNDRSLGASLAAALDWWREAGVDMAFVDAPQDWLETQAPAPANKPVPAAALPDAARNPPRAGASTPPAAAPAPDESTWPQAFEDFARWWLEEPSLVPRSARRLPPRGPRGAALMVLVPMPAEDDTDTLLSGRSGRLLDAMLAAFGIDPANVYRAAALPARIALPDWAALGEAGLGKLLQRHVALAAPQRLLVFGKGDISALLAHSSAQNAHHLRALNHENGTVTAGFEYDLETLLVKPGWKAGVWQRWLEGASPLAGNGALKT